MAHVVAIFDSPLQLSNGRIYTAQASGRLREDGRWEGWLEFVPDDTSVVLRTERETTQRNLADLEHWASTLTPIYLQGALERTLTPPPPVVVDEPVVPSIYDEPAPSRAAIHRLRSRKQRPRRCSIRSLKLPEVRRNSPADWQD
jgi:hypothetical protein